VAAALAAVVLAAAPAAVARRVSLVKAPDAAPARARMSAALESVAAMAFATGAVVAAPNAWACVAAFAAGASAAASRAPHGRSAVPVVWAPAFAALTVSAAAVAAGAATSSAGVTALTAVCAAAGLLVGLVHMPPTWVPLTLPVAAVSAVAAGTGTVVLAAERPEHVWIALAIAGAAALAAAGRTPRPRKDTPMFRRVSSAVGVLLLATAYWDGLAYAGVTVVEAYTLPPGLVLLVVGGRLRRTRPELSSWQAFGVGLALVLLPSLPLAVADQAVLRPALLGAASLACLVAGARLRLQAPLLTGAGVLAVIAVSQLSEPVLSAYHALPRWAVLAGAGVLLIALGAGYERRLRDLSRFGRAVRSLD